MTGESLTNGPNASDRVRRLTMQSTPVDSPIREGCHGVRGEGDRARGRTVFLRGGTQGGAACFG